MAIVDGRTGKALAYRSIRQLLGNRYRFLNRQRRKQQEHAHQRHVAQTQGCSNLPSESNLGQQVDRLIAKSIITLAQDYNVGSIALPNLADVRERIQCEIQSKAEQRIPDLVEAQKQYAKQYRLQVHNWSYARLIQEVRSQASRIGIQIEFGQQCLANNPQQAAKDLASSVYQARISQYN